MGRLVRVEQCQSCKTISNNLLYSFQCGCTDAKSILGSQNTIFIQISGIQLANQEFQTNNVWNSLCKQIAVNTFWYKCRTAINASACQKCCVLLKCRNMATNRVQDLCCTYILAYINKNSETKYRTARFFIFVFRGSISLKLLALALELEIR